MWGRAGRVSKTPGDAAIVKVDTATIATDLETQRYFSITAWRKRPLRSPTQFSYPGISSIQQAQIALPPRAGSVMKR